jgi:hypothetical protein
MRRVVTTLTRNGIFTVFLSGTLAYLLGFAILDHWAYGGPYSQSIDKGFSLIPTMLVIIVALGFLAETANFFHELIFHQTRNFSLANNPLICLAFFGGFFTGLIIGAISVFLQEFLKALPGMVMM